MDTSARPIATRFFDTLTMNTIKIKKMKCLILCVLCSMRSSIPNRLCVLLQVFQTKSGHIMTFNVLEMDIEPDATAWIRVYDGRNTNYPLLAKIPVINGTLPQGLSSTGIYMLVAFSWTLPEHCPTLTDCVKFTIMLDSGPGEFDVRGFDIGLAYVEMHRCSCQSFFM